MNPLRIALSLLATLAVACATTSGAGSSLSPQDRELVDKTHEAIGVQGRQLFAAEAEPAPDCARVCLLVGNICALAERICAIASQYPASDPVAADCLDGRARCQHAREASGAGAGCACRQGL